MEFFSKRLGLACALVFGFAAAPASAVPLRFTFAMPTQTYETTIASNPVPFIQNSAGFAVFTSGLLNGVPGSFVTVFTSDSNPLGSGFAFDGTPSSLVTTPGQVYSGTSSAPVFTPGVFTGLRADGAATLTISPGAPAPELGGGLLAGALALLALAASRLRGRKPGDFATLA